MTDTTMQRETTNLIMPSKHGFHLHKNYTDKAFVIDNSLSSGYWYTELTGIHDGHD